MQRTFGNFPITQVRGEFTAMESFAIHNCSFATKCPNNLRDGEAKITTFFKRVSSDNHMTIVRENEKGLIHLWHEIVTFGRRRVNYGHVLVP